MILPRDSPSSTNLAPIIAAVLGGIVAVAVIATVVYFIRRDRRDTRASKASKDLHRQQRREGKYQQRGLGATTYRIDHDDTELTLTSSSSPLSKAISAPLFTPLPQTYNPLRLPHISPTSPVNEATIQHLASVSASTANPVAIPALYRQAQLMQMHDVNNGTDDTSATDASAAGPMANPRYLAWRARRYEQGIREGKSVEEAMLGSEGSGDASEIVDEGVGVGGYGYRGRGMDVAQRGVVVPAPLRLERKGLGSERWL